MVQLSVAYLPGQVKPQRFQTAWSFPNVSGLLPAVSGLSRRPPLLLLPGCSGQTLRGLTARGIPQVA